MKGFGGFGGGDFFWRNSPSPNLPAWPAPVLLFLSEGLRAYRIPVSSGAGCLWDDHTSKVQCSKNFSGNIFFFSQNGPACSSLIHSPSCLEAMLSFPCILPMQADKKRGTRTSLRSDNGTPFAQPPHQPYFLGVWVGGWDLFIKSALPRFSPPLPPIQSSSRRGLRRDASCGAARRGAPRPWRARSGDPASTRWTPLPRCPRSRRQARRDRPRREPWSR